MAEDQAEMRRLEAEAEKVPQGCVAGCLVRFSVADGAAMYLVRKESPLVLQHVDLLDGYGLPAAHIRGLRLADIQLAVRGRCCAA